VTHSHFKNNFLGQKIRRHFTISTLEIYSLSKTDEQVLVVVVVVTKGDANIPIKESKVFRLKRPKYSNYGVQSISVKESQVFPLRSPKYSR